MHHNEIPCGTSPNPTQPKVYYSIGFPVVAKLKEAAGGQKGGGSLVNPWYVGLQTNFTKPPDRPSGAFSTQTWPRPEAGEVILKQFTEP